MFALFGWDTLEYQNRPVFYDRQNNIVLTFHTKKEAEKAIPEETGRLVHLQAIEINPFDWKTKIQEGKRA